MKKILIATTILLAIILVITNSWRFTGFSQASNVDGVNITIQENDGDFEVKGYSVTSYEEFKGYKYKIVDDELHIGVFYTGFSILGDGSGNFEFTVSTDNYISKVYQVSGDSKELLWEKQD